METTATNTNQSTPGQDCGDHLDRKTLVLLALSDLSRRFADNPDFGSLIELVLYTVSGQFSSTNAFAIMYNPSSVRRKPVELGTGKYRDATWFSTLRDQNTCSLLFEGSNAPRKIADLTQTDETATILEAFTDHQVAIAAPIMQGDKLIGIVGLGNMVTKRDFTTEDIGLLSALLDSITPLVINSFISSEVGLLNKWFINILDNVAMGVLVFDHQGRLKRINAIAQQILHSMLSKEALPNLDESPNICEVFPSPVFSGWADHIARVTCTPSGRDFSSLHATGPNSDRVFSIRVSTAPWMQSEQPDVVVVVGDITEQKSSEARMIGLEKFADKGVMAASIAHDLNNYLALLLGGAEMAQLALKKGNTEKVTTHLEKIKDHVRRIERFTTGLMDYTRFEARRKTANINDIAGDVLSFLRSQSRFKRINVEADLELDLPSFDCDPDQVAQLLLNFLNNAADAINEAAKPAGLIVVKTQSNDDGVMLSVWDNGTGIKPELRDKLFRAHFTTKPTGHGYGLVTCAKILDNHNAKIDIQSEYGQSSTFTITFPRESTQEDPA